MHATTLCFALQSDQFIQIVIDKSLPEKVVGNLVNHVISTSSGTSSKWLLPKNCSNCNEGNTQEAKFCNKCKMIMGFEGYQEALESQKEKEHR